MSESTASTGVCERSHWGLFDRVVKTVRTVDEQQQATAYRSLSYLCHGKRVELRQPLEGAGTRLMHGDFARKISPSEEALATYILKRSRFFQGRRVLVLGAGLGLAGFLCASCTRAREVLLTDGDPEVVKLLKSSLALQQGFDDTTVAVQQLLWDRADHWPDRASYDVILGADVVYLEDLHLPLLDMMSRVLAPGGHGFIFASKRHGSLENFVSTSKAIFGAVEVSMDYDAEVEKAIGRSSKCFPVFVKIAIPMQEGQSDSVQRICQRFAELREQKQQEASAATQKRQRQLSLRRARSESLLQRREQRLVLAEQERMQVVPVPPEPPCPPRVPLLSTAELEGRSDWGIFARSVKTDGDIKEMTYHCGKCQVRLRRHPNSPRITCAEEALAAWVLKARGLRRSRVLELGAGTGLAGLVAACISRKHVELTDGDPNAVEALQEAVAMNRAGGKVSLGTRQLKFGEVPAMKKFDLIIAAEILEKDSHMAILRTARKLLKASGRFVFVAATGFDAFLREAQQVFPKVQLKRDYDDSVSKAMRGMPCRPKLAILRRPVARKVVKAPEEALERHGEEAEDVEDAEDVQDAEDEGEATEAATQNSLVEHPNEAVRGLKKSQSDPGSQFSRQRAPKEGRSEGRLPKGPGCHDRIPPWDRGPDHEGLSKGLSKGAQLPDVVRPLIRRVKSLPVREGKLLTLPKELC